MFFITPVEAATDAVLSFWNSLGMQALIKGFPFLWEGAWVTLELTVLSVGIGLIIGLIAGLGRLSRFRPVYNLATAYVDFFRGTPLLVQLFLFYYAVLPIFIEPVPPFFAAVVACSINSGAYIAEIVRGGIQSIDPGQMEAALSLGMSQRQAMTYIILPQAFKVMIPPLINEFIAMLKDTSLVCVIGGVEEMTRKAQLIIATNWQPFAIWTGVAILYLIMTMLLSRLGAYVERRLATE